MFDEAVSALRRVPVTAALLGCLVLGWLLVWVGRESLPLWRLLLYQPPGNGEAWRLITPIFLHFSTAHAAFNGLILWLLGGAIERFRGGWVLVGVVLAAALGGNMLQYQISGSPLFGGMSGVGYALLGYCLVWQRLRGPGLELPPGLAVMLLVFLLIGLSGVLGLLFGLHIANGGHVGGLLGGVLIGLLDVARTPRRRRQCRS